MRTATQLAVSVAAAALLAFVACEAAATTYVVQPDGGGDYPTIQAAVDAAIDGDYIALTDGTFEGDGNRDIVVPAKQIYINSQSGNYLTCQIDCDGTARSPHRGFHFTTAEGTGNAQLQGVGIINGYVLDGGGGIWIEGADPTITNCAVAFCVVDNDNGTGGGLRVSDGGAPMVNMSLFSINSAGKGGGVAIDGAAGTFNHCEISDNIATNLGGGVYIQASELAQFGFSDIISNEAPYAGGVRMGGASPYLQLCNISRNEATSLFAGGVLLQAGWVSHCTLVDNSSTEGGAGVHCHAGTGTIEYSLIAFSQSGYGIGATAGYAPTVSCCDVYGNVDGDYDSVVGDQTGSDGNISLDPQLCGLEQEDYTVSDESPCLPGHHECGETLIGAFEVGCESPVETMSWGRLKAMWR